MHERQHEDRRHCPKCNARIHPLDLSDLLLGRKRECPRCFSILQAQTTTAIGVTAAIAILVIASADTFFAISWWHGALAGMFVAALLWIAPPGLIAGAPWVRIVARDPEHALLGIQKRARRMAAINSKQKPGHKA